MNIKRQIITKRLPEAITIGLTKKCNLACLMCPYKESRDNTLMSLDLFHKIEKALFPYVYNVCICGAGEAFLHPDLPEILKTIGSYNFKWGWQIITNGLLMNTDMVKAVVDNSLVKLVISVDGATEETYRRIRVFGKSNRGNINFKRVMATVDVINGYIKRMKKNNPKIWFNFVAMQFNIHELPLLVKIAQRHNVERIDVVRLAYRNGDSWGKYSININSACYRKIIKESMFLGDKLGVKVSMDYYEGYLNRNRPCPVPWEWANIAADGEFIPCSWIEKLYNGFEIGNLNKQSFMEIWNNKKMQRLRQGILDGTYAFCKRYASPNCTHLIKNEQ